MIDFSAFNNFFDHIYVITLQRAIERQDAIKINLAGLNYHFFWGADKQAHSMAEMSANHIFDQAMAIKNSRQHKPITHGHICCSWSHKNVYLDIVNKGYQKVLILEDDVVASPNRMDGSKLILNELPQDWELLYLDYNKNEKRNALKQYWYHVQKLLGGLTWSHKTVENLYPKKVSEHLSTTGYHDYTSAYAVTFSAAEKLIALQTPIAFNADNLLAHAATNKIVNGFIARPKLFAQLSQGTDKQMKSYVED